MWSLLSLSCLLMRRPSAFIKDEGSSWEPSIPSPGSQASLHQQATCPYGLRWKTIHLQSLSFIPCSAERWQDVIQPCWRLRELRACCQSLCCCGLTDKLADGIHEPSTGLCYYSLKQLSSLKVAPEVAFSLLKHHLRWSQNNAKCSYYSGNQHLLPAVWILPGPVGTAWVITKSKLSLSVSCLYYRGINISKPHCSI